MTVTGMSLYTGAQRDCMFATTLSITSLEKPAYPHVRLLRVQGADPRGRLLRVQGADPRVRLLRV